MISFLNGHCYVTHCGLNVNSIPPKHGIEVSLVKDFMWHRLVSFCEHYCNPNMDFKYPTQNMISMYIWITKKKSLKDAGLM